MSHLDLSLRDEAASRGAVDAGRVGPVGRIAGCARTTWLTGNPSGGIGDFAGGRGSPANRVRFSRSRGTVQQGPVQRQETQIVQPRK